MAGWQGGIENSVLPSHFGYEPKTVLKKYSLFSLNGLMTWPVS